MIYTIDTECHFFLKKKIHLQCVCVNVCVYRVHMEFRGKLVGVGSLLKPMGSGDQMQAIRSAGAFTSETSGQSSFPIFSKKGKKFIKIEPIACRLKCATRERTVTS